MIQIAHISHAEREAVCDPYCGCGYKVQDGKYVCGDAVRLVKLLKERDDFDEKFIFDGDSILAKTAEAHQLAVKIRNTPCPKN